MLALAACAAVASCRRTARPGLEPKHLLLVTIENLRADRLSCAGHLAPTSRFDDTLEERVEDRAFGFDELARGGVLFANASAPSSATIPSLAALMTGRSPIETGVLDDAGELDARTRTLAGELRRAGFLTVACISAPRLPLAPIARDGARDAAGDGFEDVRVAADDVATLDEARAAWKRDVGDGRSTFTWIHLSALALPWDAELVPSDGRRFVAANSPAEVDGSSAWLERVARGETAIDDAARERLSALYDERLRATLERLRAFLADTYDWTRSPVEASETWKRTLLVACGTSGLELGEHGAVGPALSPHDEALAVPLVVRHPDSATGERVCTELVTLEDVAPTVLEWFELPIPPETDGRSLLARLDTELHRSFDARPSIAVLPGPTYRVRGERFRAVWNRWWTPLPAEFAHPVASIALYDGEDDPRELHDAALDRPDAVAWAKAAVERWRLARTAWRPPNGLAGR